MISSLVTVKLSLMFSKVPSSGRVAVADGDDDDDSVLPNGKTAFSDSEVVTRRKDKEEEANDADVDRDSFGETVSRIVHCFGGISPERGIAVATANEGLSYGLPWQVSHETPV